MNTEEVSLKLMQIDDSKRQQWFKLLSDPVFMPVYNYPNLDSNREHTFKKLQKIWQSRLFSVRQFATDPNNIFSSHEFVGLIDPSTAIKHTVQMNLFGGTCFALHNGRHDYLFDQIDNLEVIGCFGLTELGYGNNAVQMETTATYDQEAGQFVVNSPTALSQKYWISNGYNHATHCLVFGQTIVRNKNEGVNAFLVPIRDANKKVLPGVTVKDMGIKIGVNGVDNAVLRFDNVRIPRVNMMNKYGDVDSNGDFQSEYKRNTVRFFKVTERLLSGRICIAGIAMGGTRACLSIAIRYAQQRKSIGPEGLSTVPIMNYQLQQNAILPLLARTFALNTFYNFVKKVFANPGDLHLELPSLCSVVKTTVGWNFSLVASTCRERCGGMGYLSSSRFGEYLAVAHTCLTAEGDNRVLMHKIVKDISQLANKGIKLRQPKLNVTKQIATFNDVTQLDTLEDLFRWRLLHLYQKIGQKMAELKKEGVHAFDIQMHCTSDLIQDLAAAYGEERTLFSAMIFLSELSANSKKVMETVFRVYACDVVKQNLALFVQEGAISATAATNLINAQNLMIKDVAANIEDLFTCLNAPEKLLYAPCAQDYVGYFSRPNFGEVVAAKL